VAVVTLPQLESNLALLHALKQAGFNGRITAAVRDATHGRALLAAGVSDILNPFHDAADRAAEQLAQSLIRPEPRHEADAEPACRRR
jgi:Trk K+ transport system NAD-binding subunit